MALVLIIEDNPANMRLAVFLMTVAGHEVLQAVDAEAGIALARARHPKLILMDIQLPGMDGLAATQLLKGDAATQDIHIIALTALAMAGDRQKIEAAGCDGYLAKPIRYHELLKLVGGTLTC
jgi:two-component system cell cycle response regulator DivK